MANLLLKEVRLSTRIKTKEMRNIILLKSPLVLVLISSYSDDNYLKPKMT